MASNPNRYIIITTIGNPTDAIMDWIERYRHSWNIVIVGDRKTPETWKDMPVFFMSVDIQKEMFPALANMAPYNHYSRKNLGYLYALSRGAEYILETDDDNFPYTEFGEHVDVNIKGRLVGNAEWVNIYQYFSEENIWPRGLPLDAIHQHGEILDNSYAADCLIQQYLVDDDPDVDAIWRLVFGGKDFRFNRNPSVIMQPGSWVPFNSQNTIFFADALPLLYLPHFVSFRMTDIWRSFVAQAALWVYGSQLAFHCPTAKQLRNEHHLMSDFEAEIPGYSNNDKMCKALAEKVEELHRSGEKSLPSIAKELWLHLIGMDFIPSDEAPLVKIWFDSIASIAARKKA